MINSMTGYGRSEVVLNTNAYTIEMKSVNHRYLDVAVKMPRKISFYGRENQAVRQAVHLPGDGWMSTSITRARERFPKR